MVYRSPAVAANSQPLNSSDVFISIHVAELYHDRLKTLQEIEPLKFSSYSSRSSDGNSSLLNEGGSASQVPQASVELKATGVWSGQFPFLSGW